MTRTVTILALDALCDGFPKVSALLPGRHPPTIIRHSGGPSLAFRRKTRKRRKNLTGMDRIDRIKKRTHGIHLDSFILSILSILFESASGYLDDSVLRGALNAISEDITFSPDNHLSINDSPRMIEGSAKSSAKLSGNYWKPACSDAHKRGKVAAE